MTKWLKGASAGNPEPAFPSKLDLGMVAVPQFLQGPCPSFEAFQAEYAPEIGCNSRWTLDDFLKQIQSGLVHPLQGAPQRRRADVAPRGNAQHDVVPAADAQVQHRSQRDLRVPAGPHVRQQIEAGLPRVAAALHEAQVRQHALHGLNAVGRAQNRQERGRWPARCACNAPLRGGTDGWTVNEMQRLPRCLVACFLELLHRLESASAQEWPVLLPKA